jgi:Leucine-rich repeat (LRR) protein
MFKLWQRFLRKRKQNSNAAEGEFEEKDDDQKVVKTRNHYFKRIPRSQFEQEDLDRILQHFIDGDESYLDYLFILYKQEDLIASYILWELEHLALLTFPEEHPKTEDPLYLPRLIYRADYLNLTKAEILRYPLALDWLYFRVICFFENAKTILYPKLSKTYEFKLTQQFEEPLYLSACKGELRKADFEFIDSLKELSIASLLYFLDIKAVDLLRYMQGMMLEKPLTDVAPNLILASEYLQIQRGIGDISNLMIENRYFFSYYGWYSSDDLFIELLKTSSISVFRVLGLKTHEEYLQLITALELYPSITDLRFDITMAGMSFPMELFELSQLETLGIHKSGDIDLPLLFNNVSKRLAQLKKLAIHDASMILLDESILNCSSLKGLSFVAVKDFDLEAAVELLKEMTALRTLVLESLKVSTLPPNIAELKQIKELNLSRSNSLEMKDTVSKISKLTQLESLDLSYCDLTIVDLAEIKLNQLRHLSLDGNRAIELNSFLFHQSDHWANLEKLELHNCNLSQLPEMNLPKLRELVLSGNEQLEMEQVFKAIQNIAQLKELNLRDCNISSIPEQMFFPESLRHLNLNENPNIEVDALFAQLKNSKVYTLYLDKCDLSSLSEHLLANENLQVLSIEENPKLDPDALFEFFKRMNRARFTLFNDFSLDVKRAWKKALPFISF